ncbi:cell wall protein DAN4-like [Cheilinus undulatus]|uniref:cell wall protein DAN4-like n=1 Tax=Cheilinus undulatus TaxID=241271 RepID=UPI001BD6A2BD|nr:cell wall protein DAN4-like [Cheilinus undulatus]
MASSDQPSTTEAHQKRPVTMSPNMTTTEATSTTGFVREETTQYRQPSTTHVDQTRTITSGTPNPPFLPTSTTTGTQNRRITTETLSTTGVVTTEIPSLMHSSTTNRDLTITTTELASQPFLSTYTVSTIATPNERTTKDFEATTGHVSTEIKSSEQPSTTGVHFRRPTTNETPDKPVTTISTVTPDPTTTMATKSTTGYISEETTQFTQTSITHVDKARAMTSGTQNQPFSSTPTTTGAQNRRTTTETSTSTSGFATTEIPSSNKPFTMKLDQATTATTPDIRATSGTASTTGVQGKEITPLREPSTTEVIQTKSLSDQTTQESTHSTTMMTQSKGTTTDVNKSTTGHPSTVAISSEQPSTLGMRQTIHMSSTTEIPNKITANERLSTMIGITSDSSLTDTPEQHSTSPVDQTRPSTDHVFILGVKLSSKSQLSDDNIKELVSTQIRDLLIEKGIPSTIKVGVIRRVK